MFHKQLEMVRPEEALPGRITAMPLDNQHYVLGSRLKDDFPDNCQQIVVAMGCFWGVERLFWQQPGIYTTAVGYAGGFTPNPTYEETCTGYTGHTEVVLIVYDPKLLGLDNILQLFWEEHDPTQGMRQGNDRGSQYRSAIYTYSEADLKAAQDSQQQYQKQLTAKGFGKITTEIKPATDFYYAEQYHQQYLAKNPGGYCNLRGTGIKLYTQATSICRKK